VEAARLSWLKANSMRAGAVLVGAHRVHVHVGAEEAAGMPGVARRAVVVGVAQPLGGGRPRRSTWCARRWRRCSGVRRGRCLPTLPPVRAANVAGGCPPRLCLVVEACHLLRVAAVAPRLNHYATPGAGCSQPLCHNTIHYSALADYGGGWRQHFPQIRGKWLAVLTRPKSLRP
jgi:hypothetical protein